MHPRRSTRWRLAQYLEHRWWRRYLRDKPPETYLRQKNRYWKRVLEELELPVREGERVLDAGCGPAGIFIHLRDRQRVTALDPLLDEYEKLPVFKRSGYPEVRFIQNSLETVPTLEPFDTIYCFNAINHVADWDASLDALTALARPGSRLVITSDVHRHAWLLPVFRGLPGDLLHPQQHTASDYTRALTLRGWRIDRERVLRTEAIFEYRAWVCRWPVAPQRWCSGGSVA
jgi:2-polyprenyl-6-hydroxyphenyl methylase/3-demethylubiquinone-9 3-methyltransferase